MRKFFIALLALGTFAFVIEPALAGRVSISKKVSAGQLKAACDKAGGFYTGSSGGGYSCTGDKGSVTCNKNGNCWGTCKNCGGKAAAANGGMGGILTNTTGGKAQPLQPQQVTTSPGRAPTQQTRSPKTAQPLTAQKTTASPRTASPSSTRASQSLRQNGR
jgi:hypothetical protein